MMWSFYTFTCAPSDCYSYSDKSCGVTLSGIHENGKGGGQKTVDNIKHSAFDSHAEQLNMIYLPIFAWFILFFF